jgi:hypothetical protein
MNHFPDSDTGYNDTERGYFAHDAEKERANDRNEARFEAFHSSPADDAHFETLDAQLTAAIEESELDQATRRAAEPNYGALAVHLARMRARSIDQMMERRLSTGKVA